MSNQNTPGTLTPSQLPPPGSVHPAPTRSAAGRTEGVGSSAIGTFNVCLYNKFKYCQVLKILNVSARLNLVLLKCSRYNTCPESFWPFLIIQYNIIKGGVIMDVTNAAQVNSSFSTYPTIFTHENLGTYCWGSRRLCCHGIGTSTRWHQKGRGCGPYGMIHKKSDMRYPFLHIYMLEWPKNDQGNYRCCDYPGHGKGPHWTLRWSSSLFNLRYRSTYITLTLTL